MAVQTEQLSSNWSLRKQIVVSWSTILAIASIHSSIPSARPFTISFFELPYSIGDGQYLQGSADGLFVLGWLVMISALRATVIEGIYQFVTKFQLLVRRTRMRFAEQGYLILYSATSFLVGMHILANSSYWLNFEELWSTWPSRQVEGKLKWYFLVQLAFWLQQLLALNLEKKRKDYSQMFTHHIVTSFLMYVAYAYRWTKVGNVVLVIMDIVDVLLPLAKLLKYCGYEKTCNTVFVVFLATWLAARHGIYNILCWCIYRDVPRVMPFACYRSSTEELETDQNILSSRWRYFDPFLNQAGTICLDKSVKWVFLGLLFMLQVLSLVWFTMIVRVALIMVKGEEARDTRSSDEDEEDEEEEEEKVEEDAECKEILANGIAASGALKGKALASGSDTTPPRQPGLFQNAAGRIRVPGSRDRKDVLQRIGCNG